MKDVKKKVSTIYRNGKAKVTGKGNSYDITQPEAPTFANPLFEGGEGVASDASVEGVQKAQRYMYLLVLCCQQSKSL